MRVNSFIQSRYYVALFFVLLALLPAVYCAALGDLFRVKTGTDKGGTDGRTAVLQQWLDDTETLVSFLLRVLPGDAAQVDAKDLDLAHNLHSYFRIRVKKNGGVSANDVAKYTAVREKFTNLEGFLKRQNPDWTQDHLVPWLFVNSDWQEETELYFNANGDGIDESGDVIMGDTSGANQANLRTWNPPNYDQLDDDAKGLFDDMKLGSLPNCLCLLIL
jgi:hypothetical protein